MELKENEFQCSLCKGVFEKARTDEEAHQEAIENFGEEIANDEEEMMILCSDCFALVDPKDHPEKLAAGIVEYYKQWSNKNHE